MGTISALVNFAFVWGGLMRTKLIGLLAGIATFFVILQIMGEDE